MRKKLMMRIYGHCFDAAITTGKLLPRGKARTWWFVNVTAPLMDEYWGLSHGATR